MTRTQYYTATSVDGFIADSDNSLGWLFEADAGDAKDDQFAAFFSQVGAMAMGATTYEWILDHDQMVANPERWRSYYRDTPCWVFTHRALPEIPGVDITFVHGDVAPVHADMTLAANGANVWLVGGGELVGQFLDQDLLDEIRLGVAPVFLGAGAPLLPRRLLAADLTLSGVQHSGQFALLTYQVRRGRGDARRPGHLAG